VDDSYSFAEWAARQKFIITPASTTFLETFMLKVPTVNIDSASHACEFVTSFNPITALAYSASKNPNSMDELFDIIKNPESLICESSPVLDEHLKDFHNLPSDGSASRKSADEIMKLLESSRFPAMLHRPKFVVNMKDWLRFFRACIGGTNHQNFNYKSGYHKFPASYKETVRNILNNTPVIKEFGK